MVLPEPPRFSQVQRPLPPGEDSRLSSPAPSPQGPVPTSPGHGTEQEELSTWTGCPGLSDLGVAHLPLTGEGRPVNMVTPKAHGTPWLRPPTPPGRIRQGWPLPWKAEPRGAGAGTQGPSPPSRCPPACGSTWPRSPGSPAGSMSSCRPPSCPFSTGGQGREQGRPPGLPPAHRPLGQRGAGWETEGPRPSSPSPLANEETEARGGAVAGT